ncbi:MAG: carboxypeptidase-like regulatory domain-containing protein [Gemmatimonadaceae bacterium]
MVEILDRSTARTIVVMMFTALMATACAPRMTVEHASSTPASPDSVYDGRVQVAPDATIPLGEIEGVVRTEDSGAPLGKATVSATSLDTRRTMQVSTDEQGRLHLSGLPLGRPVLQSHLIGYTRAIDTLDLRSGVSVILGLHVVAVTSAVVS